MRYCATKAWLVDLPRDKGHTMRAPLFKPTTLSIATTVLAIFALSSGVSQAQQVYRIVGPDGKVTFSDRAPDTLAQPRTSSAAAPSGAATLPYELAQVAARYPVTLYTGNDCAPCGSARNLLTSRGIPFAERTVNTNDDIDALKRLSGSTNLPFGTIGSQQLIGFSDTEWTQYLDAAGYPKQSQLPSNYRRPAASPLVASIDKAAPAEAASPTAPATPAAQPQPPRRNTNNPANISF
jgi:glutaredoxin